MTRAEQDGEAAIAGLTALLEMERRNLLRFLAARCGDPSDAEDLLQELWLKVAKAEPIGPIANGRAYLFRMANNLAVDRARARRRRMRRDREWIAEVDATDEDVELRRDPAPSAERVMVEAEEAQIVRRAVEALPQGARRALLLYRFQGHSQGEIAAMMGISLSGVEKHLALAMRRLRTSLNDCGFFEAKASGKQETVGDAATDRNSMP